MSTELPYNTTTCKSAAPAFEKAKTSTIGALNRLQQQVCEYAESSVVRDNQLSAFVTELDRELSGKIAAIEAASGVTAEQLRETVDFVKNNEEKINAMVANTEALKASTEANKAATEANKALIETNKTLMEAFNSALGNLQNSISTLENTVSDLGERVSALENAPADSGTDAACAVSTDFADAAYNFASGLTDWRPIPCVLTPFNPPVRSGDNAASAPSQPSNVM